MLDRGRSLRYGRRLASALLGLSLMACGHETRAPGAAVAQGGAGAAVAQGGAGGGAGAAVTQGGAGAAVAQGGAGGSAPEACATGPQCQRLCSALADDPAACGLGDRSECGCLCEERFNSPCHEPLVALADCIRDAPSVDCATRGRIFPGCEDESLALEACDVAARGALCAADQPTCTALCRSMTLAFCSDSPRSVAACLCGCEATIVARCAGELDAFMGCSDGAPELACDESGGVLATKCVELWRALATCMAVPAPGLPDAG